MSETLEKPGENIDELRKRESNRFPDIVLREAIRTRLGLKDDEFINDRNILNISHLEIYDKDISNLSHISDLKNLEHLVLHRANLTNIEPLSRLYNLKYLRLSSNRITDCTAIGFLDHTLKEDCATIQSH